MIPVFIPCPRTADEVKTFSAAWLEANKAMPQNEKYPALSGVLRANLEDALLRIERMERDLAEARMDATLEAIR